MSTNAIDLKAEKREQLGTRASRRLRRDDRLPAVVYGHQQEALSVTVPKTETLDHLRHGAHLFNLQIDGTTDQVLLKDVQYDHLGIEILHLDLFRVNLDEEIHSEVPVVLVGEARGIKQGGILTQMRDTVEVIAKVRDLPDELRINVGELEIGQALHIGEVPMPAGVRLPEHEADFTVAMVSAPKIRGDEEVADETGAEPEILREKKPGVTPGDENVKAKTPNA